jgi:hypothetical protein
MKSFPRSKRGSVLLVSLIIASVVAIALSSYLQMTRTAMQISQRSFLANDAMNVAESVLEQTLWSFNQTNTGNTNAWDNWSAGGVNATDDRQRRFGSSNFTLAQGATASAKVYVRYFNSTGFPQPIAVAEATILPSNGQPITKEVEVYLTRRSFFSTGLVAKNGVTFSGQNATVDSWNSDPELDGAGIIPYSTTVRQAHGSVATTSITATVDVQNADIFGYVSVGSSSSSAITLGTGGKITGDFAAASGTRDDTRVATNFTADLPDVTTPSQIGNGDWQYYRETGPGGGNHITGAGRCRLPLNADLAIKFVMINGVKWYCYSVEYVNMTGNAGNQLIIDNEASTGAGYNVILRVTTSAGVQTAGSAGVQIAPNSKLAIYTDFDVDITGDSTGNGGVDNQSGQATGLQIWGTATSASTQSIKIAGNGTLSAIVYAPNASVTLVGNGEVYGAMVGKTVHVTGNANFHYDESLAAYGGNNPFKVASWRELRTPAERATYTTMMNF